jgi:hypothetical protein
MKPRPADLDVKALEEAFYAQPSHAGLRTLQTLHDEAQLLVWRTLKELRKFVSAKEDQVRLRGCEYAVRCFALWLPSVLLHVASELRVQAGNTQKNDVLNCLAYHHYNGWASYGVVGIRRRTSSTCRARRSCARWP